MSPLLSSHQSQLGRRCLVYLTESHLHASLTLDGASLKNLERPRGEQLANPLRRLRNMEANKGRGQQRGPQPAAAQQEVAVNLVGQDGETLSEELPNESAWPLAASLQIGESSYKVAFSPPQVTGLAVHGIPLVGYPQLARFQLEEAVESECVWQWYRLPLPVAGEATQDGTAGEEQPKKKKKKPEPLTVEQQLVGAEGVGGNSPIYTPVEEDLGHRLAVQCLPARGELHGQCATSISAAPVEATEANFEPVRKRQAECPDYTDASNGEFRVVSWNVLSDPNCDTHFSRTVLYPYCNHRYLVQHYRQQLYVQEILGYKPDIAGLQEVTVSSYTHYLGPMMRANGYEGIFSPKVGSVPEGSALFWRTERFEALTTEIHSFREEACKQENDEVFASMKSQPRMEEVLKEKVTTLLQYAILKCKSTDKRVLAMNSHLFFHPRAPHIRALQHHIMMRCARRLVDECGLLKGHSPAVVHMGDFNCIAHDACGYDYLQSGEVDPDHKDWDFGKVFSYTKEGMEMIWGDNQPIDPTEKSNAIKEAGGEAAGDEVPFRANLKNPMGKMLSAYSLTGGEPSYTTVGPSFSKTLDYITFWPETTTVVSTVPTPSDEECRQDTGCPSGRFPSDHLPIIAKLAFKQ